MPTFGPSPETPPNHPFHPLERPIRHDMTVIVCPTTNNRVEHPYQVVLFGPNVPAGCPPNFFQEVVLVLFGRFNQELAVIFANVLAEKVEPLLDMRDAGFLW